MAIYIIIYALFFECALIHERMKLGDVKSGDWLSFSTQKYDKIVLKVDLIDKKVSSAPLSGSTRVRLQRMDGKYLHLMSDPTPVVLFKIAPPNRNNIFVFDKVDMTDEGGCQFRIHTLYGKDSTSQIEKTALYLSVSNMEGFIPVVASTEADVGSNPDCIFSISIEEETNITQELLTPQMSVNPPSQRSFSSSISKHQLRRFVMEGYLQFSSLISTRDVVSVRKLLHHQLGQIGSLVPGAIQGGNFGKFSGEMTNHPKLRELVLNSPLKAVLETLLGTTVFNLTNLSCQIAFRFPEMMDEDRMHASFPSIDWHTDGERQGSAHSFTLLVGICLSDVQETFSGNLTVWPTSHWLMHRCKDHDNGAISLSSLHRILSENPSYGGMIQNLKSHDSELGAFKREWFGGEQQLLLRAGDVVVMHSDLAHGGAPNLSDSIREMLYFRIKPSYGKHDDLFTNWDSIATSQLTDIWYDLQGVKNLLGHEIPVLTTLYSV